MRVVSYKYIVYFMALIPSFKESDPIELWSTELVGTLAYSEFERIVLATAAANHQRYTGYLEMDEDLNVSSFIRTRYPRKKYGVASIAECEEGVMDLANNLSFGLYPDRQIAGFRVVMGLLEGYDTQSPLHTIDEVSTILGKAILAKQATVFAVRHDANDVSVYTEPVAVLQGATRLLPDVYQLADSFKQERFAVEDFNSGTAYMVETRFCTEPD